MALRLAVLKLNRMVMNINRVFLNEKNNVFLAAIRR